MKNLKPCSEQRLFRQKEESAQEEDPEVHKAQVQEEVVLVALEVQVEVEDQEAHMDVETQAVLEDQEVPAGQVWAEEDQDPVDRVDQEDLVGIQALEEVAQVQEAQEAQEQEVQEGLVGQVQVDQALAIYLEVEIHCRSEEMVYI